MVKNKYINFDCDSNVSIKRPRQKNFLTGFTLSEVMIALLIGSLITAGLMNLWYFSLKSWGTERIRSRLRSELQIAMERIKDDVRISSANQIYFYPENATECSALSLAQATLDAYGFVNLSGGTIDWYKTVIYHVYTNDEEKSELRKTVFWPRDNTWTTVQFQNQLNSVVVTGDGEASNGAMNTSTETLFYSLVDLKINPKTAQFDLYSPTVQRNNIISFGSIMLSGGAHNLKFEIVGKNISATDRNIGIDCLSLSPSGGMREAESYIPPAASSGKAVTKEDMTSFGNYSGNYQLHYASTSVEDYITLSFYYDLWHESNFQSFNLHNVVRTSTDLLLRLANREEGAIFTWDVNNQTGGVEPQDCLTDLRDKTIRSLISNSFLYSDDPKAVMVRVKFRASPTKALHISKAYISERVSGTQDAVPASVVQLYFSDAPVQEGDISVAPGTVGAGPTEVLIPANYYVWSNWAYFTVDKDTSKDYFVTFYIANDENGFVTYWPDVSRTNCYTRDGDHALESTWGSLGIATTYAYAFTEIQGWFNQGTAISNISSTQVGYDTKLDLPNFNQIKWIQNSLADTSASFKVRTSDDPLMAGAPDWSTLPTYSSNPSSLVGLTKKRYVQFQATLSNSGSYANFPTIDDCMIDWPGATALVEISGYFTKGPQYGIFKLSVDGKDLTKGTEVTLTNSEVYSEKTYSTSLTSEVSPRNSGK